MNDLKKNILVSIHFTAIIFVSLSCALRVNKPPVDDRPIAFPGAEGYGKYTTGGRGGKVFIVSNLNDSGPGSLREAAKAKEPRVIVFSISGTIHLESELAVQGNVTIAGQTAPGDGICLADRPASIKGNNVIIRFIRFRLGDKDQNKGMVDGAGSDDAFGAVKRNNLIVDHCSMSWSTDEVCSLYAGDNVTLQWNIMSEPLNYSYHFETGDKDFEKHGYGGIWGGNHASFHHNLFAHCSNRTPRFDGIRNVESENVDYRNNVIYNWGGNNVYAGEGGSYNIVNNYYKYGPSTDKSKRFRIFNPYKTSSIPFGKFYVNGNYVDGAPDVTQNNLLGVVINEGKDEDKMQSAVKAAFSSVEISLNTAEQAYSMVLKHAGAFLPVRDTLDQRIMQDVRSRTGRHIDVQGGFAHGTPYALSKVAWPELKSRPALQDSDFDGMPDQWEKKQKLDPSSGADAALYGLDKMYTNLEVYLNSLVNLN